MFVLQLLAKRHVDTKIVCSLIRYPTLVKVLLEKHKLAIKNAGFEGLLQMHPLYIRRIMLVDLAMSCIIWNESFHLCGKEI
jgi:hypothetical protein